ncbi:hypothetical protein ACFRJ9_21690 [Paenarthrobacter sp. NPDC056912]|uniref:hypothetical protein n=1 Tax=Paenarthrobacter sp. NPDC056912 TaxID=3345965 RepID=UPI00366DFD49
MSIVDSNDGVMDQHEANECILKLKNRLRILDGLYSDVEKQSRQILDRVIALWEGQAWLALGYETWEDLVRERQLVLRNLPKSEQSLVVRELSMNLFSSRAIGAVLGASHTLAQAEKRKLEANGVVFPTEVRSLNGSIRKRTVPHGVLNEQDSAPLEGQLVLPGDDFSANAGSLSSEPDWGRAPLQSEPVLAASSTSGAAGPSVVPPRVAFDFAHSLGAEAEGTAAALHEALTGGIFDSPPPAILQPIKTLEDAVERLSSLVTELRQKVATSL